VPVTDPMIDTGLTGSQLWTAAWLLGAGSAVAWLFLALEIGDNGGWDAASAAALGVGVTCSVFSACCAVLVAIKRAERRVRQGQSTVKVSEAP
jgi:hypothetical protein